MRRGDAALWLLVPWLLFVLTGMMAPLYSDEPWQLASLLVLTVAGFAVLVIPALLMVFVRTRLLFLLGVLALSASAVFGMVTMVRSDDAQAGLALLWTPYLGTIAAIVLATLDFLHRRRGKRSRIAGDRKRSRSGRSQDRVGAEFPEPGGGEGEGDPPPRPGRAGQARRLLGPARAAGPRGVR